VAEANYFVVVPTFGMPAAVVVRFPVRAIPRYRVELLVALKTAMIENSNPLPATMIGR